MLKWATDLKLETIYSSLLQSDFTSRLTGCDEPNEPCCVKVTAVSGSPLLSICSSTCELCHPWDTEAVSNHLVLFLLIFHCECPSPVINVYDSTPDLFTTTINRLPARLPSNLHMNHVTPFTNCCCILPPSYASGAEPLAFALTLFVDTLAVMWAKSNILQWIHYTGAFK